MFVSAVATFTLAASKPEQPARDPQQGTPAEAPKTTRPPAPFSSVNLIQRGKYEAPCRAPQDHDTCDLEAQWKAADAADKAAWWAVMQAVFSAAGLIGLIVSLYYTRKAVLAAEDATRDADTALAIAARNADAAAKQVEVAEANAKRQLRAYLSVKSIVVDERHPDDDRFSITLEIINNGLTPASVTRIVFEATWAYSECSAVLAKFDSPLKVKIHKDTPMNLPWFFDGNFVGNDAAGHILAIGRVEYIDAFGASQKDSFAFSTLDFLGFHDHDLPIRLGVYPIDSVLDRLDRDAAAGEPGTG